MTSDEALVVDVALLLEARIGLIPDATFRSRLSRALRDVARATSIDGKQLVDALAADEALLDQLLDRVTVQETGFFRHPEHFAAVVAALLPTIGAPVRAWSAACANGQEAYSLAMLMQEAGVSGEVLASDISPAALRRTVAGLYREGEMRGVSAERRRHHFAMSDDGWQVHQGLRDMLTVRRHNLLDPIPSEVGACQLVMCRNVLIYLTPRHAALLLDRLADAMNPDAHLFVGGAETLWQIADRFEPVRIGECFAYRVRQPRTSPRVSAASPPARPRPLATTERSRSVRASAGSAPVTREKEQPIDETGTDQHQLGRELMASGLVREAIVAFRKWTYLTPEDPTAHFQLAMALDAADERSTARRAYSAALTALDRCDTDWLATVLQGYDRSELRRLLAERSRRPSEATDHASATKLAHASSRATVSS